MPGDVLKDPHIHVEKTPMPGFGHAAMRALITEATGLVPDLPKTVGTAMRQAPPDRDDEHGRPRKSRACPAGITPAPST